ncbi:hypothetical protein HS088_TW06G00993 [Tripterygium wilfordii]|uniref:Pentatricopeptide repeat-containing protein n=1 Tax=Tripterygium wilfordii TaxID=458696 RepID=A0A7J7DKI5_TRIWF|nr:pentatricopeptide repeat-containing protein At1g19720-like [Tripterygium wilfordii]KAF5746818.1 hypothetical protein HS088_TW06G00993 [Tripterygium wilfordii]
MAALRSGLLPCHSFNDHSQNFNICRTPNFKFRASTSTFCGRKGGAISVGKTPKAHVSSITQNAVRTTVKYDVQIEVDHLLSLYLYLFNGNSFSDCRQIHAQFVKLNALRMNNLIGNKLAIMYIRNNAFLECGRKLFDEMPEKTLPSYAAVIGSYCRSGQWEDLFSVFSSMVDVGLLPDEYMIPTILKACSAMQMIRSGKMIHGYVIRKGLNSDVFIGNAFIDLYANCRNLGYSTSVFDTMTEKDVVSWTALASAYMDDGLYDEAMSLFQSMEVNGVKPDVITWNTMISRFARNGEIGLALQYFEEMQKKGHRPTINSWNGIISGFVQSGYFDEGLNVFKRMLEFPEYPDFVTTISLLPACAGLRYFNLGRAFHGYALKRQFSDNSHLEALLIEMYSKCGRNSYAENVFLRAKNKNTEIGNAVIAAYLNGGGGNKEKALRLLKMMGNDNFKPDVVIFNNIIAQYAGEGQISAAYDLLSEMNQMGVSPDVVTFNVLISGFQQSGLAYEALKLFRIVLSPSSSCLGDVGHVLVQPNSITFTGALAACADLKLQRQGKELHGYLLKKAFERNNYISTGLVDMYAKCHDINAATKVFKRIEDKTIASWNALIAGHVYNMQLEVAFELFHEMLVEGIRPCLITFKVLLPACGDLRALTMGKELHGYIIKSQFDDLLANALADMYAKCCSNKKPN